MSLRLESCLMRKSEDSEERRKREMISGTEGRSERLSSWGQKARTCISNGRF